MNILMIGGTGVISSAVAAEAIRRGMDVTMINRGNTRATEGAHVIISDKDNLENIAGSLVGKHYDAIIDFICYTTEEAVKSYNFYKDYTSQYIYISSAGVYCKSKNLLTEDSPKPIDIWDYSVNKWDSEQKLMELSRDSDTPVTIVRPSITYGDTRIPYGVSPQYGYHWTLVERIKHGKPIITWNGGKNFNNMLRVEDFAVGFLGLIGNPQSYGEAFNICSDVTTTYGDVINALEEIIGKKAIRIDVSPEFYAEQVPERRGEIIGGRATSVGCSNGKLKKLVPQYKQTISLRDGIRRTYGAYKDQNYQKGIDWNFDAQCDRVARRWLKLNGNSIKGYNLGFIDYLGNANHADRIYYLREKYRGQFIDKALCLSVRIFSKIKRTIRR